MAIMYPAPWPMRPNPSSQVKLAAGIGVGSAVIVGTLRYMFAPSPFTWKTGVSAAALGAVIGAGTYGLMRWPAAATA